MSFLFKHWGKNGNNDTTLRRLFFHGTPQFVSRLHWFCNAGTAGRNKFWSLSYHNCITRNWFTVMPYDLLVIYTSRRTYHCLLCNRRSVEWSAPYSREIFSSRREIEFYLITYVLIQWTYIRVTSKTRQILWFKNEGFAFDKVKFKNLM